MFKKLLLSCAFFVSHFPAHADLKSGVRVGVGIGYKDHKAKHQESFRDVVAPQINQDGSTQTRYKGMASELAIGYDFFKDSLYSSLELNYRYSRDKAGKQCYLDLASNLPIINQQSHQHDFGLAAHLGMKVLPKMAVYGIANVRLGRFTEQLIPLYTPGTLKSGKTTQNRWGVGGGLGIKYDLINQWAVVGEATYDVYQVIKIKRNLETDPDQTFYAKSKAPRIMNLMFKVSKTF